VLAVIVIFATAPARAATDSATWIVSAQTSPVAAVTSVAVAAAGLLHFLAGIVAVVLV
jgi:hypothetical protein